MKKSLLVNIFAAGLLIPMGVILSSDDTAQQLTDVQSVDQELATLKQDIPKIAQAETNFLIQLKTFAERYRDLAAKVKDMVGGDYSQAHAELGMQTLANAYRLLDQNVYVNTSDEEMLGFLFNGKIAAENMENVNDNLKATCLKELMFVVKAVTKNFSPEKAQQAMRQHVLISVLDSKVLLLALSGVPESFLTQYISVFEDRIQENLSQLPQDLAQKLKNKLDKARQKSNVVA